MATFHVEYAPVRSAEADCGRLSAANATIFFGNGVASLGPQPPATVGFNTARVKKTRDRQNARISPRRSLVLVASWTTNTVKLRFELDAAALRARKSLKMLRTQSASALYWFCSRLQERESRIAFAVKLSFVPAQKELKGQFGRCVPH